MRRDGVIDRALLDRGEMPCPERRARGAAEDRAARCVAPLPKYQPSRDEASPTRAIEAGGDPRLWLEEDLREQVGVVHLAVERALR